MRKNYDTSKLRKYESSKNRILAAAVKVARDRGLMACTLRQVAREAHVAIPTVHYHFKNIAHLRLTIAKYAVENEMLTLLADTRAITRLGVTIPSELREKIAAYIATA